MTQPFPEEALARAFWANLEKQAEFGPGIDQSWLLAEVECAHEEAVAEALTERTAERDRFRRLYDDQQLIDHIQIQRLVDALRGLLPEANPCVSPLDGCPVCVAQDAIERAPGWAKYQPHNRDAVGGDS